MIWDLAIKIGSRVIKFCCQIEQLWKYLEVDISPMGYFLQLAVVVNKRWDENQSLLKEKLKNSWEVQIATKVKVFFFFSFFNFKIKAMDESKLNYVWSYPYDAFMLKILCVWTLLKPLFLLFLLSNNLKFLGQNLKKLPLPFCRILVQTDVCFYSFNSITLRWDLVLFFTIFGPIYYQMSKNLSFLKYIYLHALGKYLFMVNYAM